MPYGNSKKTKSAWKIATAQAEKAGYTNFSKGSAGSVKRSEIAEAVAEQRPQKKKHTKGK